LSRGLARYERGWPPEPAEPQQVPSGRRLARYASAIARYFSNTQDGLFATGGPARRSVHRGNNFRCLAFSARPADWLVCAPAGTRVWNRNAAAHHFDNLEENVPCSAGSCSVASQSSSVLKSREPGSRKPRQKPKKIPRKKTQKTEEGRKNLRESFEEKTSRRRPISLPFALPYSHLVLGTRGARG
jgi:hypothetical protein